MATDDEIIRAIPDNLPYGVWVARAPGGDFVYANRVFQEIMGMDARPDVARGDYAEPYGIHDRAGRPYDEEKMPFVCALIAKCETVVDDIVIHRGDGRKVYIRASAQPVMDEAGDVEYVLIAFQDITLEVDAEDARAESEARLARSQRMESIGNLAGGIAHDFNNLLAAIKGITQLLVLEETDDARRENLEAIDHAATLAADLTRSLLGFAGRGRNRAAPLHPPDFVPGLLDIARRTFGAGIEIKASLGDTPPMLADRSQLEQAVMNLLMNARDALDGNGTIWVRSVAEGDSVVVEVEDSGPGVPGDIQDHVFEPYFTTKARGPDRGTGLGLSTVYGIANSHGGAIEIADGGAGGALFRLRIPATSDARAPKVAAQPSLTRGHGCVLLVDDVASVRFATRRALVAAGYEVLEAVDGEDALEVYRQRRHEIGVVLLDLKMPRMDGNVCFERLRQLDANARVVITTASAMNDEVQSLLDAGAVGFVEKPMGITQLTEVIEAAISGHDPTQP